jgi:CBS domain-containing protein
MKVEQLMTKEVSTCGSDDMLNQAARVMWERDCGFVPITEGIESRRVVGIVTDRDICMAAYTQGRTLEQIRIRDVMSTGIRACRPGEDLSDAEATMRRAQVHRLPVVDDAGQLLGVISLADIARESARQAGSKTPRVSASEIGETLAAIRQPRAIAAAPPPARARAAR